jgi:hypothetical protein
MIHFLVTLVVKGWSQPLWVGLVWNAITKLLQHWFALQFLKGFKLFWNQTIWIFTHFPFLFQGPVDYSLQSDSYFSIYRQWKKLAHTPTFEKKPIPCCNSFRDEDNKRKILCNFVVMHMKNPILVVAEGFQRWGGIFHLVK